MPDTLHTRLLAALDERLERARAATEHLDPGWVLTQVRYNPRFESSVSDADVEFALVTDAPVAAYIAANDPATEIRRVEALRRVVERHFPLRHLDGWSCSACLYEMQSEALYPCADIRDLAEGEGIEVGDG